MQMELGKETKWVHDMIINFLRNQEPPHGDRLILVEIPNSLGVLGNAWLLTGHLYIGNVLIQVNLGMLGKLCKRNIRKLG